MFFMIGMTNGSKDLPFDRMVICAACGACGRYRVYMTFMQLLLFFIPCFKWSRQYYVETSCCRRTFLLNPEVGRRIEKGEMVDIQPGDLTPVSGNMTPGSNDMNPFSGGNAVRIRTCASCGYSTTEDFSYCPKCGRPL